MSTSQLGRRLLFITTCAAALVLSQPLRAEGWVTTFPVEQIDALDADERIDFDIPQLPLRKAIDAFAAVVHGEVRTNSNEHDEILVGPIRGRLSTREAWRLLTAEIPSARTAITKVAVTKKHSDPPLSLSESPWSDYRYLSSPPSIAMGGPFSSLPQSRVRAINEIAKEFGIHVNYMATTDREEMELVYLTSERKSLRAALDLVLMGTPLHAQWVYNALTGAPVLSISPAPYTFKLTTPRDAVLVVAKRLPPLDFGQIFSVNRPEIEASGATTIPEYLRLMSQSSVTMPSGATASGAQVANLRGLGADIPFLVLINGRRTMISAHAINATSFDLTTIPLPAVERIDILMDSASTRHGSDAIAGVLDIITVSHVDRPRVDASYSNAKGGSIDRRGTLSLGFGADGRPWRVAAVLDTYDTAGLLGGERSIPGNQDYRRYGGDDYRWSFGVRTLDGASLPGLSSPTVCLPSTCEPVSMYSYRSLIPEGTRHSFASSAEYAGRKSTMTAELLWVQRQSAYSYFPPSAVGILSPDNPHNPFGTPVFVDALLTGAPSMTDHVRSELRRGVLGAAGRFSLPVLFEFPDEPGNVRVLGNWNWRTSVLSSDESAVASLDHAVDPTGVAQALAASDPDQALDVFAMHPGQNLPPGVLADKRIDRFSTRGEQALISLDGPILRMHGRDVNLNMGLEYRRETMRFSVSEVADRIVRSQYAELSVPISRSLKGTAGVRRDTYSDTASATKWQYALQWSVTDNLTFGGTYGETYRPASLLELGPSVSLPVIVRDPRQNRLATITFLSGGNPDLWPTSGNSHTFYSTYSAPSGARATLRYFSLNLWDRIAPLSLQTALQFEGALPDRVRRAPPTEQELAAGMPGRLLSIDTRAMNFGSLSTSGVDVEIGTEIDSRFGSVSPKLAITWVDEFNVSDVPVPGYPPVDRVGMARERGTITPWRAVASVSWRRNDWRGATFATIESAYREGRNNHRIGPEFRWDANLSYELNANATITFGLDNILNASPPFSFEAAATGFDYYKFDPIGRRWSVSARWSF